MKKYTLEKFIYIYNLISLILFIPWIISGIVFDDPILILEYAFRFSISLVPFSWIFLIIIRKRRKKRGYKDYLSLECMRNAKNEIPKHIYKYVSLSSNKNDSLDTMKLNSLRSNQVWMSTIEPLNDVFDGQFWQINEEYKNNHTINEIEEMVNEINKNNNLYIQSSFSYDKDSILMWGHYSNSFNGYCIEYEVLDKSFLFPILYTKKRIITLGENNNKRLIKNYNKIIQQKTKFKSLDELIQYFFFIRTYKSDIWEYEKEIRLLDLSNSGSKNVEINAYGLKITKVIMGYKCKYEHELREIAKKLKIELSVMKPDFESEEYCIKELDKK